MGQIKSNRIKYNTQKYHFPTAVYNLLDTSIKKIQYRYIWGKKEYHAIIKSRRTTKVEFIMTSHYTFRFFKSYAIKRPTTSNLAFLVIETNALRPPSISSKLTHLPCRI